jgi:predicted O-linked N-acetylglucosamine transferase (SPINDLY family)
VLEHARSLHQSGNLEGAAALCREILVQNPNNADALHLLGVIELQTKNPSAAATLFEDAIKIAPNRAALFSNRGMALRHLGRLEEALSDFDRALTLKSDAETFNGRGNTLKDMKCFEEALASYDRALGIRPEYPTASYNRGLALSELRRFDEALASYDRALKIRPNFAEALGARGIALQQLKRYDEALISFDRALGMKGDHEFFLDAWFSCKMTVCDWRANSSDFARLSETVESSQRAVSPSIVLATPLSAALQRKCAETFISARYPSSSPPLAFEPRTDNGRIRLGYFSADFRGHATTHLMAELFERQDRERFELFAFSFGLPTSGPSRARLERSFDRFIEVTNLTDAEVATLARKLEIDIAVDLKGFTDDSRTGIFALRPAPIQVSYLGYPGTMGADYIDYLIADATLIPPEQQKYYSEKIVYLPNSYQVNDAKRLIADKTLSKAVCGLPEGGFVFCCFNNNYKISPFVFDIWMRLLTKVENSVLWLFEDNTAAAKNLRAEARARGVAPERLVFGRRMRLPDHLARHHLADLFLDTLPYNAHTTASDALWMGLPVLTCLGDTFPGRVAASLLGAVGLPELITHDLAEYESSALELASDPNKLRSLREQLAANRSTHPLFDTPLFTKHIESAYLSMWNRYQERLAPDHIYVDPSISSQQIR